MREAVLPALVFLYTVGAIGMAVYGLHAGWLTWLAWRNARPSSPSPPGEPGPDAHLPWPPVTVQLPVYNERHVVERLLEAAAALDYPADRLQIQLLDDSTDDTAPIADACAARLQHAGGNVAVVRRAQRTGFKAGALQHALPQATGEFLILFDADFLPPPGFARQVIAPFLAPGNERVAFVQGRWAHLNRDYSLLTRCQALALDGHFGVEQPARASSTLPFGFNGSAGAWRRVAIEDPATGGWQPDTLCEDLDLAYRAQLAGWRALYLLDATAPAEVPPQLLAFKRQQARWATGSIQTLIKLGGRVARSTWPLRARVAAFIHLGNYLVHPLLLLLLLTLTPLTVAGAHPPGLLVGLSLASLCPPLLYALAERRLNPQSWVRDWAVLPLLMLFGLGLSWNNTLAAWQALRGHGGDFARTPKFRIETTADRWQGSGYRLPLTGQMAGEFGLALYALVGVAAAARSGEWWTAFFLGLFVLGFGAMVGVGMVQAWTPRAHAVTRRAHPGDAAPQASAQTPRRPLP